MSKTAPNNWQDLPFSKVTGAWFSAEVWPSTNLCLVWAHAGFAVHIVPLDDTIQYI